MRRRCGRSSLAIGGSVQALTADVTGAPTGGTSPLPAANFTLVMGGSGLPIPSASRILDEVQKFIQPFYSYDPAGVQGLFTPEGLYPVTAIKDLAVTVSIDRGVQILDNMLVGVSPPYAGLLNNAANTVNVFGYSQSAVISSLEMRALNPTNTPGAFFNQLNFSLIGDPMNPNGGLLERFAGLTLPSVGLDFYGATPDNAFHTTITTIEYDGYADFPQYPMNFVSDLNAFAGILFLHGTYPDLTSTQLATAIQLTNTVGPTTTDYYMIPSPHLPLLDPVRAIPLIGNPLADLVEPDLKVIVDLGYGSTTQGWSTGAPNVPTPFGIIPPVSLSQVANALATATPQGVNAFIADLHGLGAQALSLPTLAATGGVRLPTLLAGLPAAVPAMSIDGFIEGLETANTTATNFVTNATANLYSTLLPTADLANMLLTTVPSYDINLFLNGVEQMANGDPTGGLIYALGAPIAADTALFTLAGGFELEVLLDAAEEALTPS